MDTAEIKKPSLWLPMTDARQLAALGKLAEELGECQAAVARCIIQGLHEREPETGKVNRDWLREELADVTAMTMLVELEAGMTLDSRRVDRKFAMKREWLDMITADQAAKAGR